MTLDSIPHEIIVAELCMWPCYVCMDLVLPQWGKVYTTVSLT